jgi:hypothetical protein
MCAGCGWRDKAVDERHVGFNCTITQVRFNFSFAFSTQKGFKEIKKEYKKRIQKRKLKYSSTAGLDPATSRCPCFLLNNQVFKQKA